MKLSAPIYHLKRKARRLSRAEDMPLHQALDHVAAEEGYVSWSLLAAAGAAVSARDLLTRLSPGDLVLIGARPGHGKTLLSLELAIEAMKSGQRGAFFTLESTRSDISKSFARVGADWATYDTLFDFDNSDAINADYISEKLVSAPQGTVVVVDYLQILDQRREKPPLMTQIRALQSFARAKGLIMVFISQIDRSFDPAKKSCPDIDDVRLPNPLDMSLFDKTCFLHNGTVQLREARRPV